MNPKLSPAVLSLLLTACFVQAQEPQTPRRRGPISGAARETSAAKPETGITIKKYDDVITKDAQTLPGVFAVHRVEDKLYFEIPQTGFDQPMLWQAEVAKGPPGVSYGGRTLGSSVLRWERRGKKVYLWKIAYAKRAGGKAVQIAVDSANNDTIVASFPVEAEGKDRSTVILVTPMFTTDIADLSVKGAAGGAAGVDESRSYLSDVKAFPTNIEVRSVLTFRSADSGAVAGPGQGPRMGGGGRSLTALVHYSLVKLPETPMMPRYFDPRVGYFAESFEKYDDPKTWVTHRQFIARYRLEKKDPSASVSEPVKPITYYLSREVPEKWRPFLKKGIEDWNPAFEEAGFKNAIVCREAPERAEDPNWDPEDARYSVIRWVAEPISNAMGPNVHDPRSGEIVSAHVIFYHDILKLTQLWYFVQCSAVDKRARHLPLPDELTGELLRCVVTHEVGHTLGLRHNHRASQAYSVQQLRDPAFTAKHGSVASIMSYGRNNYVAQPEDKVARLIPLVAPYDYFAIRWGYKPIATAKTAEEEAATLDEWAARQLEEPFLRFGGEDGPSSVDPTVLTENIGSDAVQATSLGLKNLDRALDHLIAATTTKGEDYLLLEEAYQEILTHRRNWFNAVAKQVGGVVENRALAGRGGETFVRVPKEKQKEAVTFLLQNALNTPTKLLNPAVLSQFRYSGVANDIAGQQKSLLLDLLSASRLNRLLDAELMAPEKAYTAMELVKDLQAGIWSELKAEHPKVDPLRRVLQSAYLDRLKGELDHKDSAPQPVIMRISREMDSGGSLSDLRAVARSALRDLSTTIAAALPKVQDTQTKAHLEDAMAEIEAALTAKGK
jgi:hypothetical protein